MHFKPVFQFEIQAFAYNAELLLMKSPVTLAAAVFRVTRIAKNIFVYWLVNMTRNIHDMLTVNIHDWMNNGHFASSVAIAHEILRRANNWTNMMMTIHSAFTSKSMYCIKCLVDHFGNGQISWQ